MALEHEKITEKIIAAAFEVHGILGTGFLGKVYQRAMQVELKKVEFKRFAYSGEFAFHPIPKKGAHDQTLEVTLNSAPGFSGWKANIPLK